MSGLGNIIKQRIENDDCDKRRATIRRIFMAHGFTIKEGQTDLKPYVYEAAEALLRELSPAVAVPDGYVQGIEDAAMLCQKEADELLSENRHVRNSEAETKAETASKLSEMLLSVAKDAAAQKGGAALPKWQTCQHERFTTDYDFLDCQDCGAAHAGGPSWNLARNKWFPSRAAARFYDEHGRLPDDVPEQKGGAHE